MAIVHVAFKSSSLAPPAALHAQYLARDGQYEQRGGLELLESGNMPRFAEADPHAFWVAADTHERANGRTYTEVQVALPRELSPEQRQELARETTRELLGDRFAYTLAVHTPLAKDNIDQPHMHLMFSERAVTDATREMAEDRFFKRNGAKKDPAWNDRNKPEEVRAKWVEMMNGAMQKAGIEQQLDPRSWAEQGRLDLASLREEKTLQGNGLEARERHGEIEQLRELRAELPPAHLGRAEAIEYVEQQGEQKVAAVQEREAQELGRIDRLIAAARELAQEVKERAVAMVENLRERAGALFGKEEQERQAKATQEQAQARPPTGAMQSRLDELLAGFERKMEAKQAVEQKLADFGNRMNAKLEQGKAPVQAREQQPAQALNTQSQQQDQSNAKEPDAQQEEQGKHSRGFGMGR